jgi:two-component system cell cycle response regulator CtrA
MRALIAAGEVGAAARVRTMLATEDVICDVTDLGRDSFLLSRLYDYDIILLDLTVADCEGYKLLRQLRAAGVGTPILILSGRGELDEKVKFLRFGADDFLTKPVDRRELVARILAIVRRSKGHCQSTIRTGKLAVNLDTRVVSVDDGAVRLTPKEYGILELLSLRKGSILTRGMFLSHVYGGMDEPQPKIIDIFICSLRKKLARATGGGDYIETVRGGGYVLREPATMPAATPAAAGADLSARGNKAGETAEVECTVTRSCPSGPQAAGEPSRIEHEPGVRDSPTGRPCPSAIRHGLKPGRAAFPVEMQFEDAITSDGGPLLIPRPDPINSLVGCAAARCQE